MKTFLVALVAFAFPAAAHAAVFSNGSFETGPAPTGNGIATLGAGSTAIANWVVGGGEVDYIGSYWTAANGSRSVDLSGNAPGSISQTFDTVVGGQYVVTFNLGGNGDGGLGPKTATVLANGGTLTSYTTNASLTPNMTYSLFTYNFVAAASSTTLTFASTSGNAYGPVLDNVAVNLAGVPEPTTWGLMMLGFGTMGVMVRRRPAKFLNRMRFA